MSAFDVALLILIFLAIIWIGSSVAEWFGNAQEEMEMERLQDLEQASELRDALMPTEPEINAS